MHRLASASRVDASAVRIVLITHHAKYSIYPFTIYPFTIYPKEFDPWLFPGKKSRA